MTFPLTMLLAQLNPTVGDLEGNFKKIRDIRDNHPKIDLLIFPEMITTGYPTEDLVLNPYFMDRVEQRVNNFIEESKDQHSACILPTPWRENKKIYNAALLVHDGQILGIIKKHHLPNYGVFDEKRVFEAGPLPEPVEFKDQKLGIMICEDMWFPDVAKNLKQGGANILIVPNGSPYQKNIQDMRLKQATARVSETGLPLLYVNQIGGQDELVFDGKSFVLNKDGEMTHLLKGFKEETGFYNNPEINNPPAKTEEIYYAVTLGLRDYVRKNNFPGVLLGLSGGIDSALSATIAVDALGADKVHCVMMPSPYTSQESLDDAEKCAKALGIELDTISIGPAMDAYKGLLDNNIDQNNAGTTFENIQSRARAMTLMALSNANGYMVLSTGNKSEMAVGYATLYGDMCGGFNALKDLYKTQVYELAKWRNTKNKLIPQNIITKAPTAELKSDQTDQDTLPPYNVLDDILAALIERELPPEEIKHDQEIVLKVWKMLDQAEYKRRQAPPGVKITEKAFGRNRRYPITNRFFTSSQKN